MKKIMLFRLTVLRFLMAVSYCRCSEQEKNANCIGTYRGTSGFIESPEYPNRYPDNLDCLWRIQAEKGKNIWLIIHDFELQQKYNSTECADYLLIRDMITYQVLLKRTCGTLKNAFHIWSSCHDVIVLFHSDKGGCAKGFKLSWNVPKHNYRKCDKNFVKVSKMTKTPSSNSEITRISKRITDAITSDTTVTSSESVVKLSSDTAFNNSPMILYCIVILALLLVIICGLICVCVYLRHMNEILKSERASNIEMKETLEELRTISRESYMQLDFTGTGQVDYTHPARHALETPK